MSAMKIFGVDYPLQVPSTKSRPYNIIYNYVNHVKVIIGIDVLPQTI